MMDEFHDEPAHAAIDTLFVYLSVHDHGEGICAGPLFVGDVATPLVFSAAAAERTREMMGHFALGVAKLSGRPVRLVKFTRSEIVEVLQP